MAFTSDTALSWPVSRPVDAGSRVPSSHEIEVVELFEELRDRLLRYLLALGLSLHDGEEVVQESFLLLFRHLQNGKSRGNLRGWVFRVARNLGLKQRAANQAAWRRTVEFDETLPEQAMGGSPNPEEQLRNQQRQKRLLAVARALPEQDQGCLCLRAEGLRYREIAEVLGISLGAVAASLARSLERLGRVEART